MASGGNRKRDRSRSPVSNVGRRRGAKSSSNSNQSMDAKGDMMNPMMMNSMYQPGNMLMSGMYPNMMMAGGMMGNGMANMDMSAMATGMGTGMTGNIATGMTGGMGTVMAGGMPAGMTGGMTAGIAAGLATGMTGNSGMDMGQQPMEMSPMAQTMTPAMGTTGTMDMSNMNMMGGMMMDPSMMAMGMYPNMTGDMMQLPEKKEIVLKTCRLTPPTQGTPDPPRRERPAGCRTIFVGGLPDKIKESIMREIFEMYGHINTLRLSKKNFCHIRFDREAAVDAAMRLSGYRIKLIDKEKEEEEEDTHGNSGWIHVDFALSRDDQNEFERRQRQMLRVQQAQMMTMASQNDGSMMGMDMTGGMDMGMGSGRSARRSPSPVRVQPFSNAAIGQLSEKIKSEEQFYTSLPTLLSWLERGECSKKNATQFYSMIQATNSHIRRLFNEKMQCEEELQDCKERVKNKIEKVINQLEQVAKIFSAASHQRVWDHFTKPQRKNIETWQKMTQEFAALKDEFKEKFDNEDNDFGDFNNGNNYGMSNMPLAIGAPSHEELQQYKMENDSLKFQLEAYKNEVDVIKADAKKEMEKFKAQFIARQALQGAMDSKNPPLPKPVEKPPPPPPLPEDLDSKVHIKDAVEAGCGEAKLIGVMAAFLQVHPQGASLDYVVSYVRALFPLVSQATVHHVLQKHEDVFRRATSGVGANIENRWSFVAFTSTDA